MSDGRPAAAHASAVIAGDIGILVRGPSGCGKSSLALALIDGGAELIADDRVFLQPAAGRLMATAPAEIAGMIEVRGQGLFKIPYKSPALIRLVADFCRPEECGRMPGPGQDRIVIDGVDLAYIRLPIGIIDGALRVRWAAAHCVGS